MYDKSSKDTKFAFGFNNKFSDTFRGKEGFLEEVADFNPLEVSRDQRLKRKFELEEEAFDPERYAYDNFEDAQVAEIEDLIEVKVNEPVSIVESS